MERIINSLNKTVAQIQEYLYNNRYTGRYLTSAPVRVKFSLYTSLSLNMIHAAMKMTSGFLYTSLWFGAEAVFYIVLGTVRYFILRNIRKSGDMQQEFRVYRFCGFLLFVLGTAISIIIFMMIFQGQRDEYPGLLIFGAAAFAFIFLANAIISLAKDRKLNNPIISAAKIITLIQALVALYSVQVSLFVSFGEDDRLELIMNSVFGALLCISIFSIAVFMVARGYKNIKKFQSSSETNS